MHWTEIQNSAWCQNCKYWLRSEATIRSGVCLRSALGVSESLNEFMIVRKDLLVTASYFGCNQFSRSESRPMVSVTFDQPVMAADGE